MKSLNVQPLGSGGFRGEGEGELRRLSPVGEWERCTLSGVSYLVHKMPLEFSKTLATFRLLGCSFPPDFVLVHREEAFG